MLANIPVSVMVIGARDEFRWGGGGGGGEVSFPNIFPHCLHEIKWFCPNITWFFLPENCYFKYSRGLQPLGPHGPYAYDYGGKMYVNSVMKFSEEVKLY